MANKFDTDILDTELFEDLYELLNNTLSKDREEEFSSVVLKLERNFQDLEDLKSSEIDWLLRNIKGRLKYWSLIINRSMADMYGDPFLTKQVNGRNLIGNALLYLVRAMLHITDNLKNGTGLYYKYELALCTPVPPSDWFDKSVVYSEYDLVFPIALLRELIGNYIEPKFVEFAPRATESDNDAFRWVDRIIESRSGLEWRKIYSQFTTNLINDGDIKNIPIQFHLDTSDPEVIQEVEEKIFKICELINFHPFVLLPGVKGSWLRRLVGRTHKFFTSKEVIEKVNEVEHAIKLHTIGKQQSEIDKNLAEGVSALIVSTKDIPNVAIQLGSLLFVKVTLPNGEPVISTRSLTIKEMIYLANNPGIISQPKHILEALQKNCLDLTGNGIQDQLLKL